MQSREDLVALCGAVKRARKHVIKCAVALDLAQRKAVDLQEQLDKATEPENLTLTVQEVLTILQYLNANQKFQAIKYVRYDVLPCLSLRQAKQLVERFIG